MTEWWFRVESLRQTPSYETSRNPCHLSLLVPATSVQSPCWHDNTARRGTLRGVLPWRRLASLELGPGRVTGCSAVNNDLVVRVELWNAVTSGNIPPAQREKCGRDERIRKKTGGSVLNAQRLLKKWMLYVLYRAVAVNQDPLGGRRWLKII